MIVTENGLEVINNNNNGDIKMKEAKRNYWFMGLSKWFRNRFIKKEEVEVEVTAVAKKRTVTTKVASKRKKPLKRA